MQRGRQECADFFTNVWLLAHVDRGTFSGFIENWLRNPIFLIMKRWHINRISNQSD